jgi:hypothetical protein
MQPYKGDFIEGSALLVHPFSPDGYTGGDVYVSGPYSSIVGITRFQLHQFTVSIKELAEWSGGKLPGSWWMNACLGDGAECPSIYNAPALGVTVILEDGMRNWPHCRSKQS